MTLKSLCTRREKSRVKYKRAHDFYARTTHRANAAGVSCYVCYDLLRSMHDIVAVEATPPNQWVRRCRLGGVASTATLSQVGFAESNNTADNRANIGGTIIGAPIVGQ